MCKDTVSVRIWMPTDMGAKGDVAGFVGVGHASLSMKIGETKYYITWSADGSPFDGFDLPAFKNIDAFTKGQDERIMVNFFNSRKATHKIKLPIRKSPDQADGVDVHKIERFWLDRLANRPKYSFLSLHNNCTGCVADALRAGGLEDIVPEPKPWFIYDAKSLLAWVLAAQNRLKVVNGL